MKYHGALAGFGVFAHSAMASSGAYAKNDTAHNTMVMKSINAGKPVTYVAPTEEEPVVVDERFKKTHRVWLIRNHQGIYGMVGGL